MKKLTQQESYEQHVNHSDYVSCKVAFLDYKKPVTNPKENYSIIDRGVTPSTDATDACQPVSHGYRMLTPANELAHLTRSIAATAQSVLDAQGSNLVEISSHGY